MFEQFLANGIAIAGVDVGESYGNPKGRAIYSSFYQELVETHGLAREVSLLARSRGGLMLYNWAAENPESVTCIAGIYPVCNLTDHGWIGSLIQTLVQCPANGHFFSQALKIIGQNLMKSLPGMHLHFTEDVQVAR